MAKTESIGFYEACALEFLAPTTEYCSLKLRRAFALVTLASLGMFIAGALGFSGSICLSRDACFGLLVGGGSIFMSAVFLNIVVITLNCVMTILWQRSYANLRRDFNSR